MLDFEVIVHGNPVKKINFVAVPLENREFIKTVFADFKVKFLSLKVLAEKSEEIFEEKGVLFAIYHKFLTKEVKSWFDAHMFYSCGFKCEEMNSVSYFAFTNRYDNDSVFSEEVCFSHTPSNLLDFSEFLSSRVKSMGSSGAYYDIAGDEKNVTVLSKNFKFNDDFFSKQSALAGKGVKILVSYDKNFEKIKGNFDYVLTPALSFLTIQNCSNVFVFRLKDIFSNNFGSARVTFVSDRNGKTHFETLSGDGLQKAIAKVTLPYSKETGVISLRDFFVTNKNEGQVEPLPNFHVETVSHFYSENASVKKLCSRPLIDFLNQNRDRDVLYLNTSHHGISNRDGYEVLKDVFGVRFAFYIHDLIPIEWPEYVRAQGYDDHVKRMHVVSDYADLVIVNSHYTKQCFENWCLKNAKKPPTTDVAFIGVEEKFLAKKDEAFKNKLYSIIDKSYFVCIGTIEPRKNHLLLLQVWRDFVQRGLTPPNLVLIGKRGWENQNVFNFIDQCHDIKPFVVEMNGLNDDALERIVRGAKALLFPSFTEGWGMPLVEAQSLGTPVICSDIDVFREASSGRATFINPLDALSWRDAIEDFAKPESQSRQAALERLADFVPPDWESHFRVFYASLKQTLGG